MQLGKEESISKELVPGIGIGFCVSQGWLCVRDRALVIFVGLTGVGKTTVISSLSDVGFDFILLPNRRTLTDEFIIPKIIKIDKTPEGYSYCRVRRFNYSKRYKQLFPAGMVHVLSQLQFHSKQVRFPMIFDGLRGEDEISYATKMLPKAQFVFLDAPECVRLQRLLIRNDSFDRVKTDVEGRRKIEVGWNTQQSTIRSFTDLGVPEASDIFSNQQTAKILAWVNQGVYSLSAIRDRLMILVEERRSYNPSATKAALQKFAGDRTLLIDTTNYYPQQIAQKIVQFVNPIDWSNE